MRVLVTAASKHGATFEIATAIGEELTRAGIDARVEPLEDVRSLDKYDGVVVGSGIYAGHWLGAAKEFIDQHATELALRPLWLFSSGPIGDPLKPEEDPADAAPSPPRLRWSPRPHAPRPRRAGDRGAGSSARRRFPALGRNPFVER